MLLRLKSDLTHQAASIMKHQHLIINIGLVIQFSTLFWENTNVDFCVHYIYEYLIETFTVVWMKTFFVFGYSEKFGVHFNILSKTKDLIFKIIDLQQMTYPNICSGLFVI